jgi:hypothetical protein
MTSKRIQINRKIKLRNHARSRQKPQQHGREISKEMEIMKNKQVEMIGMKNFNKTNKKPQ